MNPEKTRVVVVPCSGIGKPFGTVSREAAYELCDELRPERTRLVALAKLVLGDAAARELVSRHPAVTIDGCKQMCASKMVKQSGGTVAHEVAVLDVFRRHMRIPMKADTCSNPYRTPFRSCRTVVGAKRRAAEVLMGCPTGVKVWPHFSCPFGAPPRGDVPTGKPTASSRRLFGRAVSGGNERPNSSSRSRRSLRVTDSPARPNRRAWD